jgi:hypothetical protein
VTKHFIFEISSVFLHIYMYMYMYMFLNMISIFALVHDVLLQCAWVHIVHRGNFTNDLSDAVVNLCRLKNHVFYETCNSQFLSVAALLWLFSRTSPASQESGVWQTQSSLK